MARRPSVVHIITGLSRGGAESALFRLLASDRDCRDCHVVSLTDEGIFAERIRSLGVAVTCLHMKVGLPSPRAFFRLLFLLRTLRPGVAQTWMYHADFFGGIAARLAGIPVYWGVRHSDLSKRHNKRSTLLVARACALLSGFVPRFIVSCSHQAASAHRAFGYADRFVVIQNGLDLSAYRPQPSVRPIIRADLALPTFEKVVGHVGRGHLQKDHANLFSAFEQVLQKRDDVKLLMVGKDLSPESVYFSDLKNKFLVADNVVGLGPRDDVPDLMQSMDIFVLSSMGEAFPNVVAEAMACGIPCVVTDVGDAAEIVGDTGWVVPPGDSARLASAILDAISEAEEIHMKRSRAARKRVEENFDVKKMSDAYCLVWNRANDHTRKS